MGILLKLRQRNRREPSRMMVVPSMRCRVSTLLSAMDMALHVPAKWSAMAPAMFLLSDPASFLRRLLMNTPVSTPAGQRGRHRLSVAQVALPMYS